MLVNENKKFLISFFCLSTRSRTFLSCYWCLKRFVKNVLGRKLIFSGGVLSLVEVVDVQGLKSSFKASHLSKNNSSPWLRLAYRKKLKSPNRVQNKLDPLKFSFVNLLAWFYTNLSTRSFSTTYLIAYLSWLGMISR